jgi:hypothetical protein
MPIKDDRDPEYKKAANAAEKMGDEAAGRQVPAGRENVHPIFHRAREESKGGYGQHVESNEAGDDLKQSDWYDADRTLVSYSHGREIHRSSNHPLLHKHREALDKEEKDS